MAARSSVDDLVEAPRRSGPARRRGRPARAARPVGGAAARASRASPGSARRRRVRMPLRSSRRSASFEVAAGQQVVGELGQQVVGVEVAAAPGCRPSAGSRSGPSLGPSVGGRGPGPPEASLLSRLVRCRPSSRNSRALASRAGDSAASGPARARVGGSRAGMSAEHRQVVGGRQVVAGVDHHLVVEGGQHGRPGPPGSPGGGTPTSTAAETSWATTSSSRPSSSASTSILPWVEATRARQVAHPGHDHRLAGAQGPAQRRWRPASRSWRW